jgi:glycosyltransferase involved in cell wall biosynthesis
VDYPHHHLAPLTILLPVKEFHPGFLRRAIDSVHAQTSPGWELLVVGEDENLEALRHELSADLGDPRVELLPSEGRRLAGALNTGMRRARAPFTAILLGDDLWAPEAVEVLSRAIARHPDGDFFHSARQVVDEAGHPRSSVHAPIEHVTLDLFRTGSPVKHLLCWRRELALSFGGMDETLPPFGTDDFDFPWTMAEHDARFVALPECLYLYRDHREAYRLTTHLPQSECRRGLRRILRKHGVGRLRTTARVLGAQRTYLRQCLYRSPLHRRLRAGIDPRRGWRETYE